MGNGSLRYRDFPDRVFTIIIFVTAIASLYGAYRKLFENKLTRVNHSLTKAKLKSLIYKYFNELNKNDIIENKDCIVIRKKISYYQKQYTFILNDTFLYFNILRFHWRMNPPVIFDHLWLKWHFKKILRTNNAL
jgi:hypothetical protein